MQVSIWMVSWHRVEVGDGHFIERYWGPEVGSGPFMERVLVVGVAWPQIEAIWQGQIAHDSSRLSSRFLKNAGTRG